MGTNLVIPANTWVDLKGSLDYFFKLRKRPPEQDALPVRPLPEICGKVPYKEVGLAWTSTTAKEQFINDFSEADPGCLRPGLRSPGYSIRTDRQGTRP